MMMIKFLGLCLVFWVGAVRADEINLQQSQVLAKELAVEYRLRVQAQDFLMDVSLFDDMGTLGRGITPSQSTVPENPSSPDNETSMATEGERLPNLGFGPPVEIRPVSSVSLEISHIGLDPIVDLRLEIAVLQAEMLQIQKSKSKKLD